MKIDLEAIDKLCLLFNCQVAELLEWVNNEFE